MSDKGLADGHKRSKSALARSLLHRDKYKSIDTDGESSIAASDAGSEPPSPTIGAPSGHHSFGGLRSSRQKAKTSSGIAGMDTSSPSTAALTRDAAAKQQDTGPTIEQSVRMFKLFEILRSEDSAAIAKAVTETSTMPTISEDADKGATAGTGTLEGTTILHLAIQCADPSVVEQILSVAKATPGASIDINARDRDGNTPLHLASMLGRPTTVRLLLDQPDANDTLLNYQSRSALDLAKTPDIFQQLQLSRSLFVDTTVKDIQTLVTKKNYDQLQTVLEDSRVESILDVNGGELATDPSTIESGGTLLHEAARKRDTTLIQVLLMHGADPFRRDRIGKLPQDVTKDDRTRSILKKSPAAAAAQRGIQEKAILGSGSAQNSDNAPGGKDAREMKGYLKKWTNYTSGYKLRWFVLEDGVLSYYKHQDDAGSACRGAINMRIAKLYMDPKDKTNFEIQGKSSVKYHLKANHVVEAKRWFWALNNAIQWAKDESKETERQKQRKEEMLRQAKAGQLPQLGYESKELGKADASKLSGKGLAPTTAVGVPLTASSSRLSLQESAFGDEEGSMYDSYEPGAVDRELSRSVRGAQTTTIAGDLDDEEEYGDDASDHEIQPLSKDAFNITAHSASLQLRLLAQVSAALQAEASRDQAVPISDPIVKQALSTYDSAVASLQGLVGDLLKISRDRDAYWQYRLDREADVRRLWEDSMARVAKEQEELEGRIGESEEKRKRTKRALREALEGTSDSVAPSRGVSQDEGQISATLNKLQLDQQGPARPRTKSIGFRDQGRRKSTIADLTNLSDSDSDEDEEFFDAVDAGEVQVVDVMPASSPPPLLKDNTTDQKPKEARDLREEKLAHIKASFKGYEDPIRMRFKMEADNRPKISLWGILKSMIGKDMTKMTLPVSFNEPTSLLQRVTEDMASLPQPHMYAIIWAVRAYYRSRNRGPTPFKYLLNLIIVLAMDMLILIPPQEYIDLLDTAADRADSTERMVYVAAFAASEYASTIGRVAKPFNPLLGETYEYVRPDKGYRFFIEQVSHHPPIGAAWAEAPKWDYYGESAVKSKFYGKSFDINPLGTWFLKLRPFTGGEEMYTWKKVTSSVIGIITGSPTVDNYGPMEIKNWTTGEVCTLDFKPRGWKASSAYQVNGKVTGKDGKTKWSIGGRWNDKIYARLTPGFEDSELKPGKSHESGSDQAFLVWEAHPRPPDIPFNLTPFVVTFQNLPSNLRPYLPPTDTRLRPDQRAMEDGEYDLAATEKNRVEEKQRAKRREREARGEEFVPKWFSKRRCEVTGEEYWVTNGRYWRVRDEVGSGSGRWEQMGVDDIFGKVEEERRR
ncbi:MAG: hypothetical protein ASARMPREDX12_007456 [Alectoria sarmentosa]|nr:MAG: hypothetical protein ASARMPREDX12_007456 [Alectoria sarmentosa]